MWGPVNQPQMPHPLLSARQAPAGTARSLKGPRRVCGSLTWSPRGLGTQKGLGFTPHSLGMPVLGRDLMSVC